MLCVSVHLPQKDEVSVAPSGGCGYTVINFNTSAQTLRCIASLLACQDPPEWIFVLDNASTFEQLEALRTGLAPAIHTEIRLYRSDINTGFARGSNLLIEQLLTLPECKFVGLLNNDAVALPLLVTELKKAITQQPGYAMAGARMHKLNAPAVVDTLGISLYKSLMPADRHELIDKYVGPTGGCALFTARFLEDILAASGYIFDERYFCYCEDTDLVLRGRLMGHQAVFVDQLLALHEGQASSEKVSDYFIAYHGLRNSIWMHLKLLPFPLVIQYLPWLLAAHLATLVRNVLSGRLRLSVVTWRDAMRLACTFRKEHHLLCQHPGYAPYRFRDFVTQRFYRRGYLFSILRRVKPTPASPEPHQAS